MPSPNRATLSQQIIRSRQKGTFDLLRKGAEAHKLILPYVLAIASRETNMLNILGDKKDGIYYGVGIMQIDIQHDIARKARDDGSWKTDPYKLIDFGCNELDKNLLAVATKLPSLTPTQVLKISASAYNTGLTNAIDGSVNHNDSDFHTTGGDYGRDVMVRMNLIRQILG